MEQTFPQYFVGTSGWTYNHWKGCFYPESLPKSRWFDYYSRRFPAVEINATFYRTFKEKKIEERLKKGEDFAAIAKKTSIDTASAKNGGDLGYFSKDQMVPEFESAAMRLKKGEISEPVKTKYGYHIIKVTDKKMGQVVEFEKGKNLISQNPYGRETERGLRFIH